MSSALPATPPKPVHQPDLNALNKVGQVNVAITVETRLEVIPSEHQGYTGLSCNISIELPQQNTA